MYMLRTVGTARSESGVLTGSGTGLRSGNGRGSGSGDEVVLKGGQLDYASAITDAREFLTQQQWYETRGIPWRRGYLLHGKPGCGKTQFVKLLVSELGLPLYILDLQTLPWGFNDSDLSDRVQQVARNSVILIKNIDLFVGGRSVAAAKLTYSGEQSEENKNENGNLSLFF